MSKIFRYECRRLMWNRFFFGILLILLFFGYQVLDRITILGAARTAPFSPWSLGDYACRMLPLLWAAALFFLNFFLSPAARRAAALTAFTPVSLRCYETIRLGAALTAVGVLTVLCLGEAALFCAGYFHQNPGWDLLRPALITLVPALVFALGSGWQLGQICPSAIFAWMAVPILFRLLPLPAPFSLWSGQFFSEYPLTLETLDPSLTLPGPVLLLQMLLLAAGILLLSLSYIMDRLNSSALTGGL